MQEIKLNSRVKFPKNGQRQFLKKSLSSLNANVSGLAKRIHVCDRTVRDWKREKNNMNFSSLFLICTKTDARLPKDIKVLPPYWSTKKASKLGGRRAIELYGSPGTLEGRRKGGLNTQRKFQSNPTYARKIGVKLRKEIKHPHKSECLAEFAGIMLGDGCVCSPYQVSVAFNGQIDGQYARYIQQLVENLFGIFSKLQIGKNGSANIVISAVNLVKFLDKVGIRKGNKVKNQVDVPRWIFEKKEHQIGCLRGLFDTDGCVYRHKYKVSGKRYSYTKMSFRNYSIPILYSIKKMLENLQFSPVIDVKHQTIYINRKKEVKKYFTEIDTSNPRYRKKFIDFLEGEVA